LAIGSLSQNSTQFLDAISAYHSRGVDSNRNSTFEKTVGGNRKVTQMSLTLSGVFLASH
jgi:hypothetical protein